MSVEDRKLSRSERSATSEENSLPQKSPSVVDASSKPSCDAVENISDAIRSLSVATRAPVKPVALSPQEDGSQEGSFDFSQESEKAGCQDDNGADPRKVFVGGLPWNTTNESFTELFSKFGSILKSKIIRDSSSGAARGYGFITFQEPSSAARAVQASEWLEIDARRIDCKFALPTVAGGQHVRKLFVGGLPKEANENTLKKHFGQYGKVINTVVMVNRGTARSRGFGFVTMASADSVLTILSTPQFISGRSIDVRKALSREQMEKGVNQMDSEDDVQQQQAYWPAAANQYSVGPQSPVAADSSANVNSAEMATPPPYLTLYHMAQSPVAADSSANVNSAEMGAPPPYLNLYHMANIGPGSPQPPMAPHGLPRIAVAGNSKMSPGSVPILPGMGVYYRPPWAHLPYPPHPPAHAGQGSPPPHMPYLPLPYISG